ncbi:mitogen-activated protein kinase kinase kinase 1-like [Papaver somniferum]|uniref:mitogen-activated protein kinase kinase kinase 1-like n=1 Tax=Papaver somniferum TaxID=3469 RepID=UPI000E701567|nr:mitogen-activated protein kinase kinase kinase 1-like [Papaver somniferum]
MVHTVSSETDFGNKIPKPEIQCIPFLQHTETKPDIKIPKSEMPGFDFSTDTKPDVKIPNSKMAATKPDIKIPKSEMAFDDFKPDIKPPKPEVDVKPESVENSLPAENPDEEEWVTVYGFTYGDKESVLQEFGKCGIVLDYDQSEQALNGRKQSVYGSEDRIRKSLHGAISLLHRSEGEYFVLAETGNVYSVTLSTTPACRCNCHDSTVPCKHIFFVFLRVLGISQNDCRIWRKGLKPCQLTELPNIPTSAEALAGSRAREEFHRLYSMSEVNVGPPPSIKDENVIDVQCPVCHQEMHFAAEAVECGSCGDVGHKRCLSVWRKRVAGRVHVCASCRQEWVSAEQNWYTNLADYMD